MALSIVRKLSTAKILGNIKPLFADKTDGVRIMLYQVAGIARTIKHGESNFGPYTEFSGDFAALLPMEGRPGVVDVAKGYRSPKAFFPEPFSGMLEGALSAAIESQVKAKEKATADKVAFIPNPPAIQFKVNIWGKADAKSSTGYTYEVENVVKVAESDALAALISEGQPVLPPATEVKQLPSTPAPEQKPEQSKRVESTTTASKPTTAPAGKSGKK